MKNYHTHTYRCKHAIGNDEDYIIEAIKGGFTVLGFSDHVPWPYQHYVSQMRMDISDIENYVSSLRYLKKKYKDVIDIKIGFEVEYFKEYIPWLKEMIKEYDIDYLILGNHYDRHERNGYFGYPEKCLLEVQSYVSQVLEAMDTGLFSYIAHPDLVFYNEDDPRHVDEIEKICIKAKQLHIPLEFNLAGFQSMRHYPSTTFLKLCQKHNNTMIIGVDAHSPKQLSDTKTFQLAQDVLKTYDLIEDISYLK